MTNKPTNVQVCPACKHLPKDHGICPGACLASEIDPLIATAQGSALIRCPVCGRHHYTPTP